MVKGGIEPLVFSIGHKDTRPVSKKKSKTPLSHVQSASPPSGGGVTSMVETFQKTYNKRASEQIYKLKMNIKQRSEKSDVYIQQEKLGQTALLRGAKKKESIKETFSALNGQWETTEAEFGQVKSWLERQLQRFRKEYSRMEQEGEETAKAYYMEVKSAAKS